LNSTHVKERLLYRFARVKYRPPSPHDAATKRDTHPRTHGNQILRRVAGYLTNIDRSNKMF
jgi:hypothetical protein